jgi:hypothetical protein
MKNDWLVIKLSGRKTGRLKKALLNIINRLCKFLREGTFGN